MKIKPNSLSTPFDWVRPAKFCQNLCFLLVFCLFPTFLVKMIRYKVEECCPFLLVIAITLFALLRWGIRVTIKPKISSTPKNAIKSGVNNRRRKGVSAVQVNWKMFAIVFTIFPLFSGFTIKVEYNWVREGDTPTKDSFLF